MVFAEEHDAGKEMRGPRQVLPVAALVLAVLPAAAAAQDSFPTADATPSITLPSVDVIGATPLLGSGVDRDKVPAQTHVLTDQDISRNGYPQALRALNEDVPGVTLDAAAGNPFQPNLLYHGFLASPLQGNPQGLAVYLNGARFNQPFGDTVNWDLIPDLAIDRMDLVGSNPVFGLNALGGALSVRMKNGFTYQGGELDLLGGSFAHYQGNLQYGVQRDNVAAYVAATGLHEGGWRDLQSSNLGNFYGDLGWRGDGGEVHINVTAAQTRLNGPGTSPVELLAVDPSAQFTAPNLITNKYTQVNLTGSYNINDTTSLQGLAYYTYLFQKVYNGNVPNLRPAMTAPAGFLCERGRVRDRSQRQPDPRFSEWRSLFRSRSAVNQHQRLWRLASGDQPRRVAWPPQPVDRWFQLRRRPDPVQREHSDRRIIPDRSGVRRSRYHDRSGRRFDRAGAGRHLRCLLRCVLYRYTRFHLAALG